MSAHRIVLAGEYQKMNQTFYFQAIGMVGAVMLGYFVTRLQERLPVSTLRRPLLGTGLCGALTTFSTVQIELLQMADRHRYELAAGYLFASVLEKFLGLYTSMNSFTQLVARSRQRREALEEWTPRAGQSILI